MSGTKKILIIDDDLQIGQLLKDFFEMMSYQALVANEAETGFQLIAEEKPDLVFLDIVMPRINGLEALRHIKNESPETIVIVVSGLQDEEIAKEAIRGGAYDYIVKPFDFTYLRDNLLARLFSNG